MIIYIFRYFDYNLCSDIILVLNKKTFRKFILIYRVHKRDLTNCKKPSFHLIMLIDRSLGNRFSKYEKIKNFQSIYFLSIVQRDYIDHFDHFLLMLDRIQSSLEREYYHTKNKSNQLSLFCRNHNLHLMDLFLFV
jgi:hypothetical protein